MIDDTFAPALAARASGSALPGETLPLAQIARLTNAPWAALLRGVALADATANAPHALIGLLAGAGHETAAPLQRALAQAGVPALALPLAVDGMIYGVLLLGGTPAHELAATLASGLAYQLAHARLAERHQRLSRQLTLINQLGQYTTSLDDRQHLFEQITQAIYEALGYGHTQLLLANPQQGVVELVHASGSFGSQLVEQGFQERIGGRGIIGWVARHGQFWHSADVRQDTQFTSHALLPDTASELALPLRIGDRVIGVLDVQSDRPNAFDSDEIFLLQTVADQIAPALEHHRLLLAERHERELATTLRDVSRIISSSLELDQVLDLILGQIGRVVPHNGARITLRQPDDIMQVVAARGYPDNQRALESTFQALDAPLTAPVLYEQRTLVIGDARTDPRWFWQVGAEQVRSWCCAPLVIKDRCIGWLCVDWNEPHFYTEAHARIVRTFADQAAVALEHARLYAAVRQLTDELEQNVQQRTAELQRARNDLAAKAAQLSALLRRVVNVQEDERQRIAHDLHDGVTQDILAAIYELHALRRRVAGPPEQLAQRIDESKQLLEQTLQEMKRIVYALRPRALDELGLHAALEHLAAALRCHHQVEVSFKVAGMPTAQSKDAELAIYRIIQEASQNSIRHAAPSAIAIRLRYHDDALEVVVRDDGRGFHFAQVENGLGIVSMRERAQAHGGTLTLSSAPGNGTSITVRLPLGGV